MIVGVDISTFRIDLAYLNAEGRPQRWHQIIGDPKKRAKKEEDVIDACRRIRIQWPATIPPVITDGITSMTSHDWRPGHGITDIAVEYPFGRSKDTCTTLGAILGVITRQAPPWARVAWPSSGELRAAIGAKNTKQSAHNRLTWMYAIDYSNMSVLDGWDEHELDALTTCIGWTKILEAQDEAV